MVALPEDEPELDCNVDMDVLPEVQALVPVNDLRQAPPAQQRIRIGVGIGGLLFGSEPNHVRIPIRTAERVAQMVAVGARDWFEECVAHCGAANVFIVS